MGVYGSFCGLGLGRLSVFGGFGGLRRFASWDFGGSWVLGSVGFRSKGLCRLQELRLRRKSPYRPDMVAGLSLHNALPREGHVTPSRRDVGLAVAWGRCRAFPHTCSAALADAPDLGCGTSLRPCSFGTLAQPARRLCKVWTLAGCFVLAFSGTIRSGPPWLRRGGLRGRHAVSKHTARARIVAVVCLYIADSVCRWCHWALFLRYHAEDTPSYCLGGFGQVVCRSKPQPVQALRRKERVRV